MYRSNSTSWLRLSLALPLAIMSARTFGSFRRSMRSGTGTSSTSRQPGSSQSAQKVRKLMLFSENTGMVSATTRPPISRARRDGRNWWLARSASLACTDNTFQFSGRAARALMVASSSTSSSLKRPRHPCTMASSVVPSWVPTASQSSRTSSWVANRLGTGLPSPSLCVDDRLVENPSAPWSIDSWSNALMVASSSGVDARPVDSGPMT
jgi:hypothetical protein